MKDTMLVLPAAAAVAVERRILDQLIQAGDGEQALLYLYILRENGAVSPQKAAAALNRTETQIRSLLRQLEQQKLIRLPGQTETAPEPEKEEKPPNYTGEEIAKELESQSPFPALVQETQRRLGRILTTADLKILFGLYDYLSLPVEVISVLITYCVEETGRQSGEGVRRPVRLRQVEREAYRWKRQGVDTLEKAEEQLKELERRRAAYGEIFGALQLPNRAPSPSEQKYLDGFLDMGFPVEVIALAYDKTMLQTGSLKWPYLNSILKRWHGKNLHTREEIRAGDGPGEPRAAAAPVQTPVRPQDQEAIEWMKELVRKQKREN